MKVWRFLGFFFFAASVVVQVYTLETEHFTFPGAGWYIFFVNINILLLGWMMRKEILSIDAVITNQHLLIKKYFFFIKTSGKKINLKKVIRIWTGQKKVIIKTDNENIELNISRLNKQVYKRLLLIQKYQPA